MKELQRDPVVGHIGGGSPASARRALRPAGMAQGDASPPVRRARPLALVGGRTAASERAVAGFRSAGAMLHDAIHDYVHGLRADGVSIERMLVLIRAVLRDAMARGLNVADEQALTEHVVRQSVEAYYGPAEI